MEYLLSTYLCTLGGRNSALEKSCTNIKCDCMARMGCGRDSAFLFGGVKSAFQAPAKFRGPQTNTPLHLTIIVTQLQHRQFAVPES